MRASGIRLPFSLFGEKSSFRPPPPLPPHAFLPASRTRNTGLEDTHLAFPGADIIRPILFAERNRNGKPAEAGGNRYSRPCRQLLHVLKPCPKHILPKTERFSPAFPDQTRLQIKKERNGLHRSALCVYVRNPRLRTVPASRENAPITGAGRQNLHAAASQFPPRRREPLHSLPTDLRGQY